MPELTACPDIDAAEEDLRRAVDRMIDLTLDPDPFIARGAADRLRLLAFRATDAIMAALRRAETPRQRERLIYVLGSVAPPCHIEADSYLKRVARDDPDEGVRHQAEAAGHYRTGDEDFDTSELETELDDVPFDSEADDPFDSEFDDDPFDDEVFGDDRIDGDS